MMMKSEIHPKRESNDSHGKNEERGVLGLTNEGGQRAVGHSRGVLDDNVAHLAVIRHRDLVLLHHLQLLQGVGVLWVHDVTNVVCNIQKKSRREKKRELSPKEKNFFLSFFFFLPKTSPAVMTSPMVAVVAEAEAAIGLVPSRIPMSYTTGLGFSLAFPSAIFSRLGNKKDEWFGFHLFTHTTKGNKLTTEKKEICDKGGNRQRTGLVRNNII